MVVCNVCQGDSFELQDGHYFCKLCHTQAEDWREEEMEVNYSQGTKFSIIMASFKDAEEDNDVGDTSQRKEPVDLDTWSTWEGLNCILVGQIREMEHLTTLPKDFNFMAFNIWAKLLQTTEVCFTKMSFPVKAAKCVRDQKWVMQQKLQNKRNKSKKRKKKKVEFEDESDRSSITSAASLRSKLVTQQYLSDTSATSSIISTSVTEVDDESLVSDADSKSSHRTRHKDLKHIKLSRKTLLGIIYLALRLTDSKVQLFDLIRWVNHNHISYRWVEHMLPGESFLKGGDRELFGPKQSLMERGTKSMVNLILAEAKHIHMILDYPYISPSDLQPLIPRLLRELCLPDELVNLIKKLLLVAKPNLEFRPDISKQNYIPVAEIRVIALIIFALKLLLGLDDASEHLLSDWADKQQNRQDLFSWARWVEFTELRKTILADHFFWAKQMFNKQAVQTENNTFYLDPSFLPAYKNKESTALNCDKKRLLLDLSSRLLKGSDGAGASYFSQTESVRPDPTKTQTPLVDGIKVALESGSFKPMAREVEKTRDLIRSSDYDYLLSFLRQTTFSSMDLEPDLRDQHERFDFKQTSVSVRLFEEKVVEEKNDIERSVGEEGNLERSYWIFPLQMDIGELAGEQLMQSNLPISFLWLLRLCSSIIDSTPMIVYKELLIVETELFLKEEEIANPILRRIVKPYRDLY